MDQRVFEHGYHIDTEPELPRGGPGPWLKFFAIMSPELFAFVPCLG
jgi:hypothetical protein